MSSLPARPEYPIGLTSDSRLGELAEWIAQMKASGTAVDLRTEKNDTPLHYAAWSKHLEASRLLLEAGADPNAANYRGQSPFHHAVNLGHPGLIRLLHAHGGNWSLRDKEGFTPLGRFSSPRTEGLRRSRVWEPGLAETLIELVPPKAFSERLCKKQGGVLVARGFAAEHGDVAARVVEANASARRLDQVLPQAVQQPRMRM